MISAQFVKDVLCRATTGAPLFGVFCISCLLMNAYNKLPILNL